MQEEKVMQEDKLQVLKILSKSIREFKKDSILCPLLVTGEVILECMIPFFTAQLVNRMKENASMQMILHYGFILVVMAVLPFFSAFGQGILQLPPPPVLPGISEKICSKEFRAFLSRILTALKAHLW